MSTTIFQNPALFDPKKLIAEARENAGDLPIIVHVHAWDKWARGGKGGRKVSLRAAGQSLDRATHYATTTEESESVAAALRSELGVGPGRPLPGVGLGSVSAAATSTTSNGP